MVGGRRCSCSPACRGHQARDVWATSGSDGDDPDDLNEYETWQAQRAVLRLRLLQWEHRFEASNGRRAQYADKKLARDYQQVQARLREVEMQRAVERGKLPEQQLTMEETLSELTDRLSEQSTAHRLSHRKTINDGKREGKQRRALQREAMRAMRLESSRSDLSSQRSGASSGRRSQQPSSRRSRAHSAAHGRDVAALSALALQRQCAGEMAAAAAAAPPEEEERLALYRLMASLEATTADKRRVPQSRAAGRSPEQKHAPAAITHEACRGRGRGWHAAGSEPPARCQLRGVAAAGGKLTSDDPSRPRAKPAADEVAQSAAPPVCRAGAGAFGSPPGGFSSESPVGSQPVEAAGGGAAAAKKTGVGGSSFALAQARLWSGQEEAAGVSVAGDSLAPRTVDGAAAGGWASSGVAAAAQAESAASAAEGQMAAVATALAEAEAIAAGAAAAEVATEEAAAMPAEAKAAAGLVAAAGGAAGGGEKKAKKKKARFADEAIRKKVESGWQYRDGSLVEAPQSQHAALLHALEQGFRTRDMQSHGLPPALHAALTEVYLSTTHDTELSKKASALLLKALVDDVVGSSSGQEPGEAAPQAFPSAVHAALIKEFTSRNGAPPTASEQLVVFARELLFDFDAKVSSANSRALVTYRSGLEDGEEAAVAAATPSRARQRLGLAPQGGVAVAASRRQEPYFNPVMEVADAGGKGWGFRLPFGRSKSRGGATFRDAAAGGEPTSVVGGMETRPDGGDVARRPGTPRDPARRPRTPRWVDKDSILIEALRRDMGVEHRARGAEEARRV